MPVPGHRGAGRTSRLGAMDAPASDPSDLQLAHEPAAGRYTATLDGAVVGFAEYRLEPGTITFFHTVVEEAYGGRGIAGRLARYALDEVRAAGERRVIPQCPFFHRWIDQHPDYQDLLAEPARPEEQR